MRDVRLSFTCNGSGAASASTDDLSGYKLTHVQWIDGNLADGVDATLAVTSRPGGVDRTVMTLTDANNDITMAVGEPVYGSDGATIAGSYVPIMVDGKLTITVASGGSATSGGVILTLR